MGCNTRERSIRGGRRARHAAKLPVPAPAPPSASVTAAAASSPSPDADLSAPIPANPTLELNLNPNPNPNPTVGLDDAGWGYCTEDQLEELLLKNLDLVYKEALSRLVSLGYDESVALRSILCNGHCYGNMDALSNIMHNTIAHLTAPPNPNPNPNPNSNPNPTPSGFTDLRNLEEYSLAGMVCLLQQIRPHLTRGDTMWCLLMSDLHVGRAASIDLPGLHPTLCRTIRPFPRRISNPNSSLDTDVVASVLKSLESMSIEEDKAPAPEEDRKKEMILELIKQIRELETQVKERKEWAQQKAMQAARKLSADLAELKLLRMEREENQRGKKGKQALEDSTMRRLSEMEAALKKASGQVDRANGVVRRLETENAEIRAEMEASKLSASESAKICQELTKKERKCLKRLAAWEKQKEKMQEEIAAERRKISQVQQQLNEVHEGQKETEMKWRQTIKAKEQAISQVEEERRAKEVAESNAKRKQEALRQKIELDFQRHKDDIRRLEEELSRLQAVAGSTQLSSPTSNTLDSGYTETAKQPKEANARMVQGPSKPQESSRKISRHRECIICTQEEVSVVFLPCAHQVVCTTCNEDHEKRAKTCCPCCNVQIEERIRVYGTSS